MSHCHLQLNTSDTQLLPLTENQFLPLPPLFQRLSLVLSRRPLSLLGSRRCRDPTLFHCSAVPMPSTGICPSPHAAWRFPDQKLSLPHQARQMAICSFGLTDHRNFIPLSSLQLSKNRNTQRSNLTLSAVTLSQQGT